ncbi:MAG: ferritin-like domain-containing protein [Oceanidesulfovibrio sp.]
MKFFKANEVAQAAVEIERKGQSFYRNVANATQSDAARELFIFMAGEEAKHEAVFQSLKDRLGEIEMPAYSNASEYQEYLEALIESHALFNGGVAEKLAAEASDLKSAVDIALSFEKDTLLFFMEMKELVPQNERPLVQQCIDEERSHMRMLRGLLKT